MRNHGHIIYHNTTQRENMDKWEKQALQYLEDSMRDVALGIIRLWERPVNEIRIRQNKPLCLALGRELVKTDHICSSDEIYETVSRLCQGSLYSYADGIKDGVITTEYGIRAGVCGRAVVRNGRIDCVRDISSINIRIPHRVNGAADKLYELVRDAGSTLVYSKPGMGKTTILRELIPMLTGADVMKNISVIDTRYELSAGIEEANTADIFLGYPRKEGIISAVRTMSPDCIICDEIADSDDVEAIMTAYSAGVTVVVTAHAGSFDELCGNSNIKRLVDLNVFNAFYGILENGCEVRLANDRSNS